MSHATPARMPQLRSLRQSARKIWLLLLTVADWRLVSIVSVVVPVLLWAVCWKQLHASKKAFFSTNFGKLQFAMAVYYDRWNALPPAVTYDEYGIPMHSWRTLLSCGFDNCNYRLEESWDSATNTKIAMYWDGFFPKTPIGPKRLFQSAYIFAITDDDDEWKINAHYLNSGTSSNRDGTPLPSFGPIVFFEAADSDIPWTQPVDLTRSECLELLRNQLIRKPIWAFRRLSTVMDALWFDGDVPDGLPASVYHDLLYGGEPDVVKAWDMCARQNARMFGSLSGDGERLIRIQRDGHPELQEISR